MPSKPTPVATWSLADARRVWAHKSGLDRAVDGAAAAAALAWARTLGGIDAYLTLKARAPQLGSQEVHDALDAGQLKVTPAARGCIYLVPASEQGLCLAVAEDLTRRRMDRDAEKAGIEPGELERVGEVVISALADRPLTTDALRKALPDDAIRSLGAAGKKVGLSSTLPPALRELEFRGRIERRQSTGRLDTERYVWRLADGPSGTVPETAEARMQAMVQLILRRGGPMSTDELAVFIGASKRAVVAAAAKLDAVVVAIEGHAEHAWTLGDDLELPQRLRGHDDVAFLAFEDTFVTFHGGPAVLTDPAHHGVMVRSWGRGGPTAIGESKHLASRSIVRGGELVGLWEFDAKNADIVWATFEPSPDGATIAGHAQRLAAFIADELGHARCFAIDSDERVQRRADAMRADGIAGAVVN